MRFCEECGAQLEDNAQFCEECGAKVVQTEKTDEIPTEIAESATDVSEVEETVEKPEMEPKVETPVTDIPKATNSSAEEDVRNADGREQRNTQKKSGKKLILLVSVCVIAVALVAVLAILFLGIFKKNDSKQKSKEQGNPHIEKEQEKEEPKEEADYSQYTKEMQSHKDLYYMLGYARVDIDQDGIEELILQYGDYEADINNEVFTISVGMIQKIGSFGGNYSFYEAPDGNGLYAVYAHAGFQTINRLTKQNAKLVVEEIESGDMEMSEPYTNDYPVEITELAEYEKSFDEYEDSEDYYEDSEDYYEEESDYDEYIIPDSSSRKLTKSDIEYLSSKELRLARNEIYARHGYIFNSQDLNDYFMEKDWYEPLVDSSGFDESDLNKYEKYNTRFIKQFE